MGLAKVLLKPFEEIIVGVISKEIIKYAIYSSKMPLVSDTGESTIKIIEREETVAIAETKEVAPPDSLEDLIFDDKDPFGRIAGP